MILELSETLFDRSDSEERRLLRRLFGAVWDEDLHIVELNRDANAPEARQAFEGWKRTLSGDQLEEVELALYRGELLRGNIPEGPSDHPGAWRRAGALRVQVERRAASDWRALRLTLHDTMALLDEPVHLHLENSRHDYKFLLWLAEPAGRARLEAWARAPNKLVVSGAGTGELLSWFTTLARRDALSDDEYRRLWRSWVMFDLDASGEDARRPSADIERLIEQCEKVYQRHGVPLSWVCLQRREIESYLPSEALLRVPRDRRDGASLLRGWRRRGDRQGWAHAFDMKKGLLGDLRSDLSPERRRMLKERRDLPRQTDLKAPFDTLSATERRALARGLGEDVLNGPLDAPRPPAWLEEIPDEYDQGPDHQLPRASLIQSIFDRM